MRPAKTSLPRGSHDRRRKIPYTWMFDVAMRTSLTLLLLLACCYSGPGETNVPSRVTNESIQQLIESKNIDLSRWKRIGKQIPLLKLGMTRKEVIDLLGEPDSYPEDKTKMCQYPPGDGFSGGPDGPDWNLVIHFDEDNRVSKFDFLKWVAGPPPPC